MDSKNNTSKSIESIIEKLHNGNRYGADSRAAQEQLTQDLNSLSDDDKQTLLTAMYGDSMTDKLNLACHILGCGTERDNQGQIVLYTDMMYTDDETVGPFIQMLDESGPISSIDPDSDLDSNPGSDPHELEEEPDSSDENYDGEIPPTLRNPDPADYLTPEALTEAAKEGAKLGTASELAPGHGLLNIPNIHDL